MIEDKLAKHYQAENLPDGHPIREAIDEIGQLRDQCTDYAATADFYRRRCDALQSIQSTMRDPERTMVCDIIANGFVLEPSYAGRRYSLEHDADRAALVAERDALRADAARYRLLAARMVHVSHPAGSGWTLDAVLVSGDRDLDETVDALAEEQICAVAKSGQIQGAK